MQRKRENNEKTRKNLKWVVLKNEKGGAEGYFLNLLFPPHKFPL